MLGLISVALRPSPYGGTTAIVLIPQSLMASDERQGPGQVPDAVLSGLHAARDTPRDIPRDTGDRRPAAHARPLPAAGAELPHRVRQANLPPHLRDQPPAASPAANRTVHVRPDEDALAQLRAAFADIRSGMQRGNRESLIP